MDKFSKARRLCRDQTLAEKVLWGLVRNRRLGGFRFLRQVTIDRYFADFVCEAAKIIVELDGASQTKSAKTMTSAALRRWSYTAMSS